MRQFSVLLFAMIITMLLSACGGGGGGSGGGTTPPRTVDIGYVLQGPPNATAESQIADYLEEKPSQEKLIEDSLGPAYSGLAGVALAQDATVDAVNAMLAEIQGSIVASAANRSYIVVNFPAANSAAALNAVIAKLEHLTAVDFALPVRPPQLGGLPRELAPGSDNGPFLSRIEHHLAVGGAAAWNARRAMTNQRPIITVFDFFGKQGKPDEGLGISFVNPDAFDRGNPFSADKTHGYHVLGILAGIFDESLVTDTGDVAGMFPAENSAALTGVVEDMEDVDLDKEELLLLPLYKVLHAHSLYLRLRDAVAEHGHAVLNTSVGFKNPNANPEEIGPERIKEAQAWARLIRGGNGSSPSELESKYFHATAAGNLGDFPSLRETKFTSGWAAASVLTQEELGIAPLTNTVAVENRTTKLDQRVATVGSLFDQGAVTVGPLAKDSSRHGNIAAIGCLGADRGIYSFLSPSRTGLLCGTSMATPQVAGLAAYLWSLKPSLTSAEIKQRLIANGVQYESTDLDNAADALTPVIDAYATVLTADTAENTSAAPVRMALLDVAGGINDVPDDIFDEKDLQAFIDKFEAKKGASADYSKYDLNGDGFTGGDHQSRFNLDIALENNNAAGTYNKLRRNIETADGLSKEIIFNEEALRDLDVLCYYAYGPKGGLYSGSIQERNRILGNKCNSLIVDIGPAWRHDCRPKINNKGDVAGCLNSIELTGDYSQAFFYSKGQRQFIAKPGSGVTGINDLGQVIVISSEIFIWSQKEGAQNLIWMLSNAGIPDADLINFAPGVINNAGQMVGTAKFLQPYCSSCPALYSSGKILNLGAGYAGYGGWANSINNNSAITGSIWVADKKFHAFYQNGALGDLGTLGGPTSLGWDINDANNIVGQADINDSEEHAFFYSEGKMNDLGALGVYSGGLSQSIAYAINNKDQVVGHSFTSTGSLHGFIWDQTSGMRDLNELVSSDEWTIDWATDINDQGQIVGLAFNWKLGEEHVVLISLTD